MKVDVGTIDGGRRAAAPDTLTNAQLGLIHGDDDAASILPIGLAESGSRELPRRDSPTLSDDLAQALGRTWTRENPVWTSEALNRMRSLQHALMKKAFSMPQDSRLPVLDGVRTLEQAISLRVRLEAALHEQELATLRGVADAETDSRRRRREDALSPVGHTA
jgi:hypothetical protein